MISRNLINENKKEKDKKLFRNIMLFILIAILCFIYNIFTREDASNNHLEATILFIRSFNSILSFLAVITCFISYNRIKKDDIFLISLMYLGLASGIFLGQIDYLSFYYDEYSLSNYLTISTSLIRMLLLILALAPKNKLKTFIVKNSKVSIIFVVLYTTIIGSLEKEYNLWGIGYTTNFFIAYNAFLAITYLYSAVKLFNRGRKKREHLYVVLGASISMLGLKAIYAIFAARSISFDVKLISVSITYIIFLLVIIGTFMELYLYINTSKMLNEKLSIFYNLTDNNKHSFMLICDESGKLIYANKKVKEYYSLLDEDNLDKLTEVITRESKNIDKEKHILKSVNENGSWRGIIKIEKQNIYIDCSIQLLNNTNGKKEIAITYLDISEEISKDLELEKLKIYNKERTEFMSNISHELRTPVNIFYSTLQLLDRFCSYDDFDFKSMYEKYRKTLHVNCMRMLRLINNVVDISKIETGILKGKFDCYNIVSLIEDTTLSVVNYAQQKNINVVFDTNEEESVVNCDPALIERAMLNLLSNAIKFSPENSSIYVNVMVREDWTEINIKDEGIGISKKDRKVIFERFMQADKSLTRANEGSGIGLSIVKSIMDLHDGYISVDSEIGKGSTFKIMLPNKLGDCSDYKIYDIDNQKTELELSDIYEVLI